MIGRWYSEEERDALAEGVAWMAGSKGMTQAVIGARLGVTGNRVGQLLKERDARQHAGMALLARHRVDAIEALEALAAT